MKYCYLLLLVIITSCQTYHYQPTTLSSSIYSKAGEVQGTVQFGSAGMAASGGIAVTENFNLNAVGSFFPETNNGYNSRELEFSAGYQFYHTRGRRGIVSLGLGYAFGSNEIDKDSVAGSFRRPFFQAQIGGRDIRVGQSKFFFDFFGGTRLNWLLYDGKEHETVIDEPAFYIEPYYGLSFGPANIRFYIISGFAIKEQRDFGEPAVIPFWGNAGFQFKLRKRQAASQSFSTPLH